MVWFDRNMPLRKCLLVRCARQRNNFNKFVYGMKLLAAWQPTSNQIHNHIERENERNAFHDNVRFSNKSNRQAHIAPCSCSCSSSTVFIGFMFGAISMKRNWRTCPTQSSNGGKGSNRSVWNNWRAMHECDDQWSWFVDCCLRAYWLLPLFCLRMSACVCVCVVCSSPYIPNSLSHISGFVFVHYSFRSKCAAVGNRNLSGACNGKWHG